jgi:hypothetical protein
MEVTHIYAIKPGMDWGSDGGGGDCCCRSQGSSGKPPFPGPHVPTGITIAWFPNPPFAGQFGELPLSDPWWKIVALIVAAIAAIVGATAAALGSGTFNPGVKGTYDDDPNAPSVQCCTPNPGGSISNNTTTVAGVCGVITSAAIAVACSDAADPVYRGEQNTVPKPAELTVSETVDAHWTFLDPPNAGVPYKTKVNWTYKRITTGDTYTYSVDEEQTNIHVVDNVEVDTPATVSAEGGRLWVHAKFTKPGGTLFNGPELYTFCFFRSPDPNGIYFLAPLLDDGQNYDAAANDGVYTATLSLEVAQRYLLRTGGNWKACGECTCMRKRSTGPLRVVRQSWLRKPWAAILWRARFRSSSTQVCHVHSRPKLRSMSCKGCKCSLIPEAKFADSA